MSHAAHSRDMEHLTTLDAGFLEAEDSDRHVSLAIGALSVIAGPMPDFDSLVTGLAERILSVPRFRQVLRTQPLDLGPPQWVDDANLDVSHHVRRAALPRPGDDTALFRWVAEVMERRLDRDRPLWECWIVDGLPNNRWAILMKIHHCIADGIAATHMLAGLCDDGEGGTFATEIRAAKEPARGGLQLPALTLNPIDWIAGAWRTSLGVTTAMTQAVQGAIEIAGGLLRPAASSSLTGPVTNMRRYATVEVSLEDVARVRDRFEVTVNDVALAAITDSFRAMLLRRGEEPKRNSLRTLVPVSVRSNDAADKTDNRVSVMLPYLPVEKSDPVEQLRAVHKRLTRGEGEWTTPGGQCICLGGQCDPVPVHRLGGSGVDPAASTRSCDLGDECAGSAEARTHHGARGHPVAPDSTDRASASHWHRDLELRRPSRLRHHRRLRRGARRRRTRERHRAGSSAFGGAQQRPSALYTL